jgi:hypothetical protein
LQRQSSELGLRFEAHPQTTRPALWSEFRHADDCRVTA